MRRWANKRQVSCVWCSNNSNNNAAWSVVKNRGRRNKLVIKIYVMERIYHSKMAAISEETAAGTVTNARRGLNVPAFDLKRGINETIRGNCWALLPLPHPPLAAPETLIFNTYIHDKWLWIHSNGNNERTEWQSFIHLEPLTIAHIRCDIILAYGLVLYRKLLAK